MDRRDELIQAGLVLASELSLSAVLQRIIELAAEITGARYGALGVVEEGRLTEFITTEQLLGGGAHDDALAVEAHIEDHDRRLCGEGHAPVRAPMCSRAQWGQHR